MVTIVTVLGFLNSAWKHGFSRQEIDHALNNPILVHYFDGYVIVIGSTDTGTLLEIGVNNENHVFHAMPARKKFLRKK